MVAAVATDEPEVAANSAQEPTFECMRPPGSQDSHCASAPYMRSAMPERSRISPISMNSGIAMSRNSMLFSHIMSPSARCRGITEKNCARVRASTPSTAAIGTLRAMSTSRTVRVVPSIQRVSSDFGSGARAGPAESGERGSLARAGDGGFFLLDLLGHRAHSGEPRHFREVASEKRDGAGGQDQQQG